MHIAGSDSVHGGVRTYLTGKTSLDVHSRTYCNSDLRIESQHTVTIKTDSLQTTLNGAYRNPLINMDRSRTMKMLMDAQRSRITRNSALSSTTRWKL